MKDVCLEQIREGLAQFNTAKINVITIRLISRCNRKFQLFLKHELVLHDMPQLYSLIDRLRLHYQLLGRQTMEVAGQEKQCKTN